ncbi:glycosyltransferase family 4 protein [Prochlorococcus marinus XMU1414]|uniref:Glycosyltransferase family 4 protein n=1 Tax=Prochlorococcus marinus XMU1424 TaxID=2774497 RepID=A0A9D9BVC4_PROMR|nr:glycosyltransferase family 4 protein [Prochlorococcus marinus]MBO8228672.1 glycosyltransferase family 4 protein [Prochlorococcus marinus XMU1414]MBW3046151.1 glycosyltransferase family 1 protein [Prochlorococcus marinus str. MU1414]MCR8531557.1 glycosyltransferase family 4 protein [Prochlorococcus marinus XMU1420]MCR8535286.1 glycosyltransferase family 4 protein [Prochlorococcus marinus XMU1424]
MKKKILFIAGNARSLIANRKDLIFEILKRNYEVSAAVPKEDMLSEVKDLKIKIIPFYLSRLSNNPIKNILTIYYLYKIIREEKPYIIYSYTIKPVVLGTLAGFLANVPFRYSMITGLGYTFSDRKNIKALIIRFISSLLYKLGISLSTKIFFQNNDDLKFFIKNKILLNPKKGIRVMGSGVNLDKFPPLPLPTDQLNFLFVGRLIKEKGVNEFYKAAKNILENYPNVKFTIVGGYNPNLPDSIEKSLLNKIQNTEGIKYVGHVKDIKPFLLKSSVFVLPSYYREGVPRASLEAMASSRPLITCNTVGCKDTVVDGFNGYLIPARNHKRLEEAMEIFIKNNDLIKSMGKNSLSFVKENFNSVDVNIMIMKNMDIKIDN